MMVVELEKFRELARKLVSALEDAAEGTLPLELGGILQNVIVERDLLFPEVLHSLDMKPLQGIGGYSG